MSEKRILKNIAVVSYLFFAMIGSYVGLADLQSSLHRDEGMGMISQSVLYAAFTVSSLFVPKLAVHLLGYKWCIALSSFSYLTWVTANGYAGLALILHGLLLEN